MNTAQAATDIISLLNDYSGFDVWWYSVDEADKNAIIEQISDLLEDHR